MKIDKSLIIDTLITIDDTGMPVAPNVRQLLDVDIRTLYNRDTSKDKKKYIQDCIVIYYLGDPKSPARQSGLGDGEALKMAIEQAGLDKDYLPDALVLRLVDKYYKQNITEAGLVVENINKSLHNINLTIKKLNEFLNDKLNGSLSIDETANVVSIMNAIIAKAGEMPTILKKLEEAKQNLMYEKQTELSRGGNQVLSSMDASEYN